MGKSFFSSGVKEHEGIRKITDEIGAVKGYHFQRDNYQLLTKLKRKKLNCIYMLVHEDINGQRHIYVGHSTNGLSRVDDHNRKRDFWSEGYLFMSNGTPWCRTMITAIEDYYIEAFKNTRYIMHNSINGIKEELEPHNVNKVQACLCTIDFLLREKNFKMTKINDNQTLNKPSVVVKANVTTTKEEITYVSRKYGPRNRKQLAYILHKAESEYLLQAGCEVNPPVQSAKKWKNKNWYPKNMKFFNDLLAAGKIKKVKGHYVLQVDLVFDSLSAPATLTSGNSHNAKKYWKIIKHKDNVKNHS